MLPNLLERTLVVTSNGHNVILKKIRVSLVCGKCGHEWALNIKSEEDIQELEEKGKLTCFECKYSELKS